MLICGATIKKTQTILMLFRKVKNLDQVRSKCCQKVATKNSTFHIQVCICNLSLILFSITILFLFMMYWLYLFQYFYFQRSVKIGKMLVTNNDILKKPRIKPRFFKKPGFYSGFFQDLGFFKISLCATNILPIFTFF